MGLFDKIKDNAKTISMKAIEATREYDEDYQQLPQAGSAVEPSAPAPVDTAPIEAPQPPVTDTPEETPLLLEETTATVAVSEVAGTAGKEKEDEVQPEKPRHSKITEVSKDEYKKSKESSKPQGHQPPKVKQPYTPSYKQQPAEKDEDEKEPTKVAVKKTSAHEPKPHQFIDVAPAKAHGPANPAFYARERAALAALASQRKLNGTVALYVTQHLNFKTRVYVDRIEYSGSFGKNVLPIERVGWVKLRAGGTGVIIETTEGKRVVMVVKPKDRLDFADAVLKVQAMQPKRSKFKDNKTVRIDQLEKFGEGVDEIEKLAKLFDKGILSQAEFDAKKKQILGL